ncbi:PorT family protein [Aquimarina sp. BL5]|uniref:porin family protein n=1 Tax=Aquimarina sp. BL5 TaxID=1714860 RepID=UPI000E4DD780|nr:porin family protein [Aquimarina sp. BL5]AXT49539.1 PorT family protein [Aquimarina sp. BL5]RKM93426.1 PorT family protein [Aquimarina sp. BL5]
MVRKLFLAFTFGALTFVNAQEESIRFGGKVGLNVANFVGDDADDDAESKLGFHIGAVVEIPITEKFAFQPELLFSTQGVKEEEAGVDFKLNLNYINVPLIFKYYFIEGLNIEIGPQVGFLVSAKAKADSNDTDVKDQFKTLDLGANIGLGYQLDMGLFFQGRYNYGITNIGDDDDSDLRNSVIQFSVGYKF